MENFNITSTLTDLAQRRPDQVAIWNPNRRGAQAPQHFSPLSYAGLEAAVNACAQRLRQRGIVPGERTLLLIQPDLGFILATIALLRLGAVPVFVEPAMGLRPLLRCLADARPSAVLAPPLLQGLSFLFPSTWGYVRKRLLPAQILAAQTGPAAPPLPVTTTAASEAIISFTSGSTGIPKGMIYRHGMLQAQMHSVRQTFQIEEGEIGMFGLSAFALLALMNGVTILLPELRSLRQSGQLDAQIFIETARAFGVQSTFAAPASLQTLLAAAAAQPVQQPALRRILLGGAPIHAASLQALQSAFPHSEAYVSLGATEITPISAIAARAALQGPQPGGTLVGSTCVGFPCPGNRVRLIAILDAPIAEWRADLELPPGTVGEITVQSPFAVEGYLNRPAETALARIAAPDGPIHRTGDLGFCDAQGRLWFVGRKAHRVAAAQQTFFPLPSEAVFRAHPAVARCALVHLAAPQHAHLPGMVIELRPPHQPSPQLRAELLALAAAQPHTQGIAQVFFYPGSLPTDIRHHSKILRDRLSAWAQRQK